VHHNSLQKTPLLNEPIRELGHNRIVLSLVLVSSVQSTVPLLVLAE